ncbi:MAG TPA: 16S rRNA (cytosine(967)-C(5))-methyltransferase RsmB [Firmicutes bacterium]|nr:16S rRNA (cytosine(967)-C(5))-methyltransferase RsmB [Bacillota bacterium]
MALGVLNRVVYRGAYADVALSNALARSELPAADRSLVTELVYGSLRRLNTIDYQLELFLKRPLLHLPPVIRNILRLGAYQLLFMHVPPHAAVDESVKLAKIYGHKGTASLVNAVLRKVADSGCLILEADPVKRLALESSVPEWLVRLWSDYLGFEETRRLCLASSERPPVTIRTNTLKTTRAQLKADMGNDGILAFECELAPEGLVLEGAGDPAGTRWFREGLYYVQDEAAMLVSRVLCPEGGETVFDLCAGPGGKTTHLAALMGGLGRIVAFELHRERARMVEEACRRMGVGIVEIVDGDARREATAFGPVADKVLLDVPCSGMGVLRRRVDLKWRMSSDRFEGLVDVQRELMLAGAACLRPHGVMVYSTCTINPMENEGQVDWFLKNHPDFELDDVRHGFEALPESALSGKFLRLMPHIHGTDGFFAARMIKRG